MENLKPGAASRKIEAGVQAEGGGGLGGSPRRHRSLPDHGARDGPFGAPRCSQKTEVAMLGPGHLTRIGLQE